MNPLNLFWLFTAPSKGWNRLVQSKPSIHQLYLLHVMPYALIPPLMGYFAGVKFGGEFFPAMPPAKLLLIAVIFYVVELVVVPVMAVIIRQLAEIAEIHPSYHESFMLAAVAPTPLWLAPIFLVVPSVLLNLAVVSLAMMAAAGFIYYGIPSVFGIKEEGHAMLMFGAVLIAGVVAWGFLMVSTLVVWGSVQNLPVNLPLA
ncbi:uncharacterized protein NMK_0263 [Novimethylophilus kurashikiensis]|uniref:Yip1 domain-containing protein n=1 Tax=Novimethylophilus kurashikiensis TaxID=1825523 RepID=A0A2R5F7S5_9PROT|nr:Yip1 family protein [Novimethylophilus kurashikiensis]GBG12731.1 uncharacterized protein NMK_0263 [Novimethylophilus kurashikiensis]